MVSLVNFGYGTVPVANFRPIFVGPQTFLKVFIGICIKILQNLHFVILQMKLSKVMGVIFQRRETLINVYNLNELNSKTKLSYF